MIRRFVNVVMENYTSGIYTLHRLDVSKHLFHQSRADARVMPLLAEAQDNSAGGGDEQPTLDMLQELPAPCLKIHPYYIDQAVIFKLPLLGLLSPRSSEDKVICLNRMGDAILYDAEKQSIDPLLSLRHAVGVDPISFSIVRPDAQEQEEDLYIINKVPQLNLGANSCFRVLRSCNSEEYRWRWEPLPPPPYIGAPSYDPARFIYSHTVVDGGRTICLSSVPDGVGTYCFDTVERQWRHAGHWILPFKGRAEYVPDLDLWLGLSSGSKHYNLCGTSDLNAMAMDQPPKLQYVWQDLVTPENWSGTTSWVVSLGSGRFCIARAFDVMCCEGKPASVDDWEDEDEVVVLTGVDVDRGGDGRLKVWKHKSIQFSSFYNLRGVL